MHGARVEVLKFDHSDGKPRSGVDVAQGVGQSHQGVQRRLAGGPLQLEGAGHAVGVPLGPRRSGAGSRAPEHCETGLTPGTPRPAEAGQHVGQLEPLGPGQGAVGQGARLDGACGYLIWSEQAHQQVEHVPLLQVAVQAEQLV